MKFCLFLNIAILAIISLPNQANSFSSKEGMFKDADVNKDGALTIEEFIKLDPPFGNPSEEMFDK